MEYFVSYYDYYQPEAYVPRTDTYIEKDSQINEQIDRMRHSATQALLERNDVVIVASVSCIYGIGSVETYARMVVKLERGGRIDRDALVKGLVEQQYRRNDSLLRARHLPRARRERGHLAVATWRTAPGASRLFGDEIDGIREFDPLTGEVTGEMERVAIYANSHYVTPRPTLHAGDLAHQGGAEGTPRGAGGRGQAAGSAAAGTAHHLRHRDDGDDRLLQRHRELLAAT